MKADQKNSAPCVGRSRWWYGLYSYGLNSYGLYGYGLCWEKPMAVGHEVEVHLSHSTLHCSLYARTQYYRPVLHIKTARWCCTPAVRTIGARSCCMCSRYSAACTVAVALPEQCRMHSRHCLYCRRYGTQFCMQHYGTQQGTQQGRDYTV